MVQAKFGSDSCLVIGFEPYDEIAFVTVVAVALIILVDKVPVLTALWYSVMAAFFPSGWNFLGRYFSPSGGYFFATARWINLCVHVMTALFLGVIVGPIYLFKAWKELRVVHETKRTFGN